MPKSHTIAGIDIGNSQVKAVIVQLNPETFRPEVIGAGSAVSNGLRKGVIYDMEEATQSVRQAVQKAESMAGQPIKRAYLSVSGLHINTQVSRGVIAVSRADNEISQSDIDRVIKAASVVGLPANREIVHVIPKDFIIDGTEHVKNPLGMKGVRLEADVLIVDGLSTYLRNVAKCVNENGIEVASLVYAPLAASLSTLDKNQKEYGVMMVDIGGGTSSLAVYEEGDLRHSGVIPLGSKHITSDIAVLLRTSIDVAEQVKLDHGCTSNAEDLRRKNTIDVSHLVGEEGAVLDKKQLIRVIDARVHELFDLITAELRKASKSGILPAGVVLSGGGSHLPGLIHLVKDKVKLPVRLARPTHFSGIAEIVDDPAYAVALGLVLWGMEGELAGARGGRIFSNTAGSDAFQKFLEWVKNFLP